MKRISKSSLHWLNIKQELRILFMLYCAAFLWLIAQAVGHFHVVVCPFRLITSLPCPACGTTRGMLLLAQGHALAALKSNLNLLFIVPAMMVYTFSLLSDACFNTRFVLRNYLRFRLFFMHKTVLMVFFMFEAFVWLTHFVWN